MIFVVVGAIALANPGAFARTLSRHGWTCLLVLLALASTGWSDVPGQTAKRAIMLTGTTLLGVYLATRFRPREILALLAFTMVVAGFVSMILGLVSPERGISHGVHEGDWRGLYGHKNALGLYMALGSIVCVLTARSASKWRSAAWAGAGLCFALVLLSQSATALVAAGAVLALLPLLYVLRERSVRTVLLSLVTLLVVGGVAVAVSLDPQAALALLGKDVSLTGRVSLWAYLLDQVRARPWLGYGYSAFWLGWSGPSELVSHVTGGWYPSHAHNGLLNLALQLGLTGVVLFLLGLAGAVYRASRSLLGGSPVGGIFSLSMISFVLFTSISESTILTYDGMFWLLYTVAVFLPLSSDRVSGDSGRRRGLRMPRRR
jgi:O-antigen ligase